LSISLKSNPPCPPFAKGGTCWAHAPEGETFACGGTGGNGFGGLSSNGKGARSASDNGGSPSGAEEPWVEHFPDGAALLASLGQLVKREARLLLFFAIILFFLAGCRKQQAPPPPPPPKVTVAHPVQRVVADALELNGTSRAVRTVQLVARVPGYLDRVMFNDGQLVANGQPLFLIQQDTTRAKLQQTEAQILQYQAQLVYAEKQLIRYKEMLRQKAAAQTDVDNWQFQRDSALGNLKNAEAQRDLARLDVNYTVVNAPFAGRMDRHLKDRGNLVGAGENTVLAELSQVDPIYVYFTVGDLDLAKLMRSAGGLPGRRGAGWPMAVALPGEEGYPHPGKLDFAASTVSDSTGTLLMRGVIPNPSGHILPGLQARVRVPLQKRSALLVPDTAVGSDQQGSYLLVVNGRNVAERRPVKTGIVVDHLRVVEEGVQPGDWVIVKGLMRAAPGRSVTPQQEGASAPEGSPPESGKVQP
jgi:RND family efflux transporter MFP subunit